MTLPLLKQPARLNAVILNLRDYLDSAVFEFVPPVFENPAGMASVLIADNALPDMQAAAATRLRTGVIGAYLSVTPGRMDELAAAAYLLGGVAVGLRMPSYAVAQFEAEEPWTSRFGGASIAGGHAVTVVGRVEAGFVAESWGRRQVMTEGFYRRFCDEALVYVPVEFMTVDMPGVDRARLVADVKVFRR